MLLKLRREHKDGWRQQGRDWITGELIRLCALLRVNTPLQWYYFWYFKGVLTWMHKNKGQAGLKPLTKEVV